MFNQFLLGVIKRGDVDNVPKVAADNQAFNTIVSLVFFAAGAVTVLFIMINAIRYIAANGDSKGIQEAKDGILYSVIGLVIVSIGFAIVQVTINIVQG